MIKVLICDDHVIVRQGLRQLLAEAGDIEVAPRPPTVPPPCSACARGHRRAAARHRPCPGAMGSTCCASCARRAAPAGHHAQHLPDRQYAVQPSSSARRATSTRAPTPSRSPPPRRAAAGDSASSRPPWPSCWQRPGASADDDTKPLHELPRSEFQVFTQLAAGRVGEIAQQLSLVQHRQHLSRPHPGEDWHAQRCRAGALRHPARRRRGAGDGG